MCKASVVRVHAVGRLDPAEPLVITFYEGGRPACRIVSEDRAAQAGRDLSSTAGWGLPVNAIEFELIDGYDDNRAVVFMTLAGTSVGCGFDSVGHAEGIYRNKMQIKIIPE